MKAQILYLWPISALRPSEEPLVEKIDTFELFKIGFVLGPLREIKSEYPGGPSTTWTKAAFALAFAIPALEDFLKANVLNLETSLDAGRDLLDVLKDGQQKAIAAAPKTMVDMNFLSILEATRTAFANTLRREAPRRPTYIVGKRGGLKEASLIDNGEEFFPAKLATKVPEAIDDIKQGMRCIAFELPTAAGYHLHRANETVLRKYWDFTTGGQPRSRFTMGKLLFEMNKVGAGNPKVKATLRDIIDHHRNPLAHPEQFLGNVNEAIALMGIIQTAIFQMLQELP